MEQEVSNSKGNQQGQVRHRGTGDGQRLKNRTHQEGRKGSLHRPHARVLHPLFVDSLLTRAGLEPASSTLPLKNTKPLMGQARPGYELGKVPQGVGLTGEGGFGGNGWLPGL